MIHSPIGVSSSGSFTGSSSGAKASAVSTSKRKATCPEGGLSAHCWVPWQALRESFRESFRIFRGPSARHSCFHCCTRCMAWCITSSSSMSGSRRVALSGQDHR